MMQQATPFTELPQRFPKPDADAFVALFRALDHNLVDAVVLCLLLEQRARERESPWIIPSYRELAAASDGMFAYRVVGKSLRRLAQSGYIMVSGRYMRAEVSVVRDMIQSPAVPEEDTPRLLWAMTVLGAWAPAALVCRLVDLDVHRRPMRMAVREMVLGLPLCANTVRATRQALVAAGVLRGNSQPGWSSWFLEPYFNDILAQEADAWLAAGSPDEPWMPGLRIAFSAGSIPGEKAFDPVHSADILRGEAVHA